MLIHILPNEYSANFNVTANADDFSAAGNLKNLRRWWSVLTEIGPKLGYYPEPTKTWLAVNKSCDSEKVESAFFRTKLKTTTEVRRQVGGSVGTRKFKDAYIIQLELLTKIATIEPESAYCTLINSLKHMPSTYTMRRIPDICQ